MALGYVMAFQSRNAVFVTSPPKQESDENVPSKHIGS
jgi:hypothetical protein